ncbi:hypothetical protein [Nitrolancea hollandica]|uniref:hypothetical protein n=1 Tax=Nitrolancea hollandica TaxID=1206749 RepID=UPI000305EDFE|nr:hypothetical protein [Nitrolancea hollandica]
MGPLDEDLEINLHAQPSCVSVMLSASKESLDDEILRFDQDDGKALLREEHG